MYHIGIKAEGKIIPIMLLSGEQVKEFDLTGTGGSQAEGIPLYAIGREHTYLGTIYPSGRTPGDLVLQLRPRRNGTLLVTCHVRGGEQRVLYKAIFNIARYIDWLAEPVRRKRIRITPLRVAAAALYSLLLGALVFFLCTQTFAALSLEKLFGISL